ncbi:MAG TPA: hypothetical protein VK436_02325 [Methanocella sp.]|nr:hypothetical protein [Methanocella sp.]
MRMSILTIVILAAIIIVLIAIAALVVSGGIICSGLTGKMATSAEALSPDEPAAGKALIVYDPGVSQAAKNAAAKIADDLKVQGYSVELAGVSSSAATNASSYDIIIVGGPIYFGAASNSITAYLKGLTLPKDAKLGVFGTTGYTDIAPSNLASFEQQITSLQNGKNAIIKLIADRDEKNATKSYQDLALAVA